MNPFLMNYLMFLIFFVFTFLAGIAIGFNFCRILDARDRLKHLNKIKEIQEEVGKYVQEVRAHQLIESVLGKEK